MVLRGILDRSLSSQLCVRGFAPIKELARISKADYSYQRNPVYLQEKTIQTFLDEEEYLFFPEVILSFQLKYNIALPKAKKGYNPLQSLEAENKFVSNVDNTQIKVKQGDVKIAEILLDDSILNKHIADNQHPFHRVDGNHRLKAAENSKSENVNRMVIPFCIILNETIYDEIIKPDGTKESLVYAKGEKFEKAVFHNINTKTIPLTSEENLRVILDDTKNFPNAELEKKFGWEYLMTRKVYKYFPDNFSDVYPNFNKAFAVSPRTFSNEIISLLLQKKEINKQKITQEKIRDALKTVNQIFGNYSELQTIKSISFIECAIYLQILGKNLELFIKWIIANKMMNLENVSASSLIDIYEKIRESKSKQIFVSMQFDSSSEPTYKAIKEAVKEINDKYRLEVTLREIRIDNVNEGHSYKIDDEILRLIEESGLLIADLSTGNKNVYHELGFLMGLNQGKGNKQTNFILLEHMTDTMKESDIGFNIRAFQQIRFTDTLDLKKRLVESLEKYYELI